MNPLHSKINTVFLGIIAVALLVIAIDTLRPRYTGYSNPYNMKMNTKTGDLFYLDPITKKFKPVDAAETVETWDTTVTVPSKKSHLIDTSITTGIE